jgi:hypothetical protein
MPNQPKTPNRSIRIDPGDWEVATARCRESGRSAADAIRSFVRALGMESPAHGVALEAAFPHLPEGMTTDEAQRRMSAGLAAALPVLREEWAAELLNRLSAYAETAALTSGDTAVVVRLNDVRRFVTQTM